MSLRFFPLSQTRSKIRLRSPGHSRVKPLEKVLGLPHSGNFGSDVDSKLGTT